MGSLKQRRGTNYILAGDFIDGPHFLVVEKESNCFSLSASEFPCIDNYSTWTADQKPLNNDTFGLKILQLRTRVK